MARWLRLRLFRMASRCVGAGTSRICSDGITEDQRLACRLHALSLYRSYRSLDCYRVVADGHTNHSAADRTGAQLNRLMLTELKHRTPRASSKRARGQVQDPAHPLDGRFMQNMHKSSCKGSSICPNPYPVMGIVPLLRYPLGSGISKPSILERPDLFYSALRPGSGPSGPPVGSEFPAGHRGHRQ